MEWANEIKLAKKAAIKAGDKLKTLSRSNILDASGRDVKHQSDIESEKIILDILEHESDYPVLAEESGEHGTTHEKSPIWVVDPLDGTLNYSQGIRLCCVSIALWQGDNPVLGVVNDFNSKELFLGVVDYGAWCNDVPISVSNKTNPQKAVLSTGFPVNRDFASKAINNFLKQIKQFKKIRLFGSAALSLAYVACGRVDAYTEEDIMFWDVAAGIALVKAAGGFVSYQNSEKKTWARNVWGGRVFMKINKGDEYDSV